jgi:hypothetical protein
MDPIWTEEKCLAAIRAFEVFCRLQNLHPARDRYQEWHKQTENTPSVNAIERKGSWNEMRRRAAHGVQEAEEIYSVKLRYCKSWTEAECLEALQQISLELGRNPVAKEYVQWSIGRDDAPSIGSILSCFGSWRQACQCSSDADDTMKTTDVAPKTEQEWKATIQKDQKPRIR